MNRLKKLQRDLGINADGLYGNDTIKEAKKKYGTTNLYELINIVEKKSSSTTKKPTSNSTTQTNSNKSELKKGSDWRGRPAYTSERIEANKANSKNTVQPVDASEIPSILPEFNLQSVIPKAESDAIPSMKTREELEREVALKDLSTSKTVKENKEAQTKLLQLDKKREEEEKARQEKRNNETYGTGNWAYDDNNQLILRKTAPQYTENAFEIPDEWDTFIGDYNKSNEGKMGKFMHALQNNYVASYLFGSDSGFHKGNWVLGIHDQLPMNLTKEETLQDAYIKALASGNRSFVFNGKTYNTTAYTKTAQDYLQARYDAEFEKSTTGKVSPETLKRLDETEAAWTNDETSRFGINHDMLGRDHRAGYPIAENWNVTDNVGQYGYQHGVARMHNAANGYLDLAVNNRSVNINSAGDLFGVADQELTDRQHSDERTALLHAGTSYPMSPGSNEEKILKVDPNLQPAFARGESTEIAYTTKPVSSFTPNTEDNRFELQKRKKILGVRNPFYKEDPTETAKWRRSQSSNRYYRSGVQNGGSMWNATEFYDPETNQTYIYDKNDYGVGPDGFISWNGYSPVHVTSKSASQQTEKGIQNQMKKQQHGGVLNYLQYIK